MLSCPRRLNRRHASSPLFLAARGRRLLLLSTLAKCEGDGAPTGASFLQFTPSHRRCGAFRRAITAFFFRRRAALCPRAASFRLQLRSRDAFWVNRSFGASGKPWRSAVSQLLAGTRSGPGRSPGAARVRGYEPRPRAPRHPRSRSVLQERPSPGLLWEYKHGNAAEFCPRQRQ